MTTVYRLPEEPPVGTVVRPEPDDGTRWTLTSDHGWRKDTAPRPWDNGVGVYWTWSAVLGHWTTPGRKAVDIVIVEPDPHPTPWTVENNYDRSAEIFDANNNTVAYLEVHDPMEVLDPKVAQRIVDAVNKAST